MGKTKEKSGKSSSTETKANGVKASRVTKPAESIKAGSKKLAAETATKVSQLKEKDSKKTKKGKSQPPPPPSDSETSESSESEIESEAESDASSNSGSSDDESVEDNVPKKAKVNGSAGLTNGAKKAAEASSDESDSSEEDSSESEDEAAPAKKPATNGAAAKAAASKEDSDDETSEGSASSDSDDDEEDSPKESAVAPPKKRKAEAETEPEAKKPKTEGNETSNLFVGNISWNVDEEWLRREFAAHGEVVGCRIMTDRATGRSKGFGYVDFADAASAAAALEAMKGYELDNRALNVDLSQPRQQKEGFGGNAGGFAKDRASKFGDEVKSSPSDTLFVGNISFSATAEAFQETFGEYGTVTRVSLPTDQETGSLKGFGYVSFSNLSEAQAALEALNGAEIEGRRIRLDFATPRTGGGDRGGRGGGRGFGGGRGGFDRGGRGGGRGFGGGRGGGGRGFGGGRGGGRGGRPNTTERGGFGDFSGSKVTF